MVTKTPPNWQTHGLFGGHPVLDFVNTVNDPGKSREIDGVPDWPTMLAWSKAAGVLSACEVRALGSVGVSPDEKRVLEELHRLRERLWRVLSRIASGRDVADNDLTALEKDASWAMDKVVLVPAGNGLAWCAEIEQLGLNTLRARLVVAALGLLTQGDLGRLRECGRCTGLFLDFGRGVGRKWCRMESCGNREKVARHRRG